MLKSENVFYRVSLPSKNSDVRDVPGFSGVGTTIACIINSDFDFIIGSGHMDAGNAVMRTSVYNDYSSEQINVLISAIRLYI